MKTEKLEDKIKEIEEIVRKLQNDEIDIDESIKMYETGMKLIKECEKIINVYEEKIKNIIGGEETSEKQL